MKIQQLCSIRMADFFYDGINYLTTPEYDQLLNELSEAGFADWFWNETFILDELARQENQWRSLNPGKDPSGDERQQFRERAEVELIERKKAARKAPIGFQIVAPGRAILGSGG
ncbi:MAG: hypothetical protein JWM59_1169 [Verrucomicrobiales bacterium]|nr:hypothetical protein [Verrucomicrobiales bacterium]